MSYDSVHNENHRKRHHYEDIRKKLQSKRFDEQLFIFSNRFEIRLFGIELSSFSSNERYI